MSVTSMDSRMASTRACSSGVNSRDSGAAPARRRMVERLPPPREAPGSKPAGRSAGRGAASSVIGHLLWSSDVSSRHFAVPGRRIGVTVPGAVAVPDPAGARAGRGPEPVAPRVEAFFHLDGLVQQGYLAVEVEQVELEQGFELAVEGPSVSREASSRPGPGSSGPRVKSCPEPPAARTRRRCGPPPRGSRSGSPGPRRSARAASGSRPGSAGR